MSRIPGAAMRDLFLETSENARTPLCDGAVVLHGFAAQETTRLMTEVRKIIAQAQLRHMTTPGGQRMSVAMSSCGPLGWVSDRRGYRYSPTDPTNGHPWPPMPSLFSTLATRAAAQAGYEAFQPDACLINRYEPGAKISLHQDKDELDRDAPIVSVSLGLPAVFLFGGTLRGERPRRIELHNGDVVVWGGPARLNFHGIAPLPTGCCALTDDARINLTFRKAG